MTETCIHIDVESMERSKLDRITGRLSLRFGGSSYPDGDWNDFVVIVLQWWLQQVAYLLAGGSCVVLRFMDGPYSVELTRDMRDSLKVDLRHAGERVRLDVDVDMRSVIDSVVVAAGEVLRECREREWESDDIKGLQEALEHVQHLCRKGSH